MTSNVWKTWCRLCGKENGDTIDVFIKDENFLSLSDAIQKFLCIAINTFDEAPTKICNICHELLSRLITFWMRSSKVQEMFSELQFNDKFEMLSDLEELRLKYNLVSKKDLNTDKSVRNEFVSNFTVQQQNEKTNENRKRRHHRNFTIRKEEVVDNNELECSNDQLIFDYNPDQKCPEEEVEDDDNDDDDDDDENDNDNDDDEERTYNSPNETISNADDSSVNLKLEEYDSDYLETRKKRICKLKEKLKRARTKTSSEKLNSEEDGKKPVAFCDICQQGFFNKGGFTFHLKSKHSIVNEPIPCKYCNKRFKAISDHQKHETTHLPPEERKAFPCPHCSKKFFSEGNLNSHVRVVHIREKSFICEECGKSFVTVDGLNSHKLVHTDEKPFQCPKCPKSFKRLPTLKLHVDSHEESKYICSICGQQLNSKALLRRHMVVHSDEKKYKCNFCEKEFKRPDAFKHHLILHTGLKPYECPFCEQTFANGSNCRKHQKTSHPQELAAAEEAGLRRVCRNVPKIEQLRAVNEGAAVEAIAE